VGGAGDSADQAKGDEMTREQAEGLVNRYLASLSPNEDGPSVVWTEQTLEFPKCWVCFWQLQIWLDTRNDDYALGGNYPIIVDKEDGALYGTGFDDVDEYVVAFNADKSRLERLAPGVS
jgi:hypothetical protein